MFSQASIRITLVLIYFTLCSACGPPADRAPADEQGDASTATATDINFIGGGTQAPDPTRAEEPYDSPFISTPPTPTRLNWVSGIRQAIRMAERDEKYRIIVWFENDECVECRTIRTEVFNHPDVLANSRKWLFVAVDTDRNPEQAEYYLAGGGPPAIIFLDRGGNKYHSYFGEFTVEELVHMLQVKR